MTRTTCEGYSCQGSAGVRFARVGIDRLFERWAPLNIILVLLIGGGSVVWGTSQSAPVGIDPPTAHFVLLVLLGAAAIRMHRRPPAGGDAELLRQARAMQNALRRYVPGAVAAQLENGCDLEPRECEVSVLFVDIRGYTAFAEGCDAADLFMTVNWYTETVSQIVQHYGGSVVEFHGDGLMAVFGAPNPLPEKARAAVEAGRAIITAMSSVTAGVPNAGSVPVSVGIGIATGKAFVGNIQTADRMIWTAIGNTSNLAARLQSLTRDLDAAIVIDAVTRAASGAAAAVFEHHHGVPIRGRRHAEDVYALPFRSVAPTPQRLEFSPEHARQRI